MNVIKVLYVVNALESGGVEQVILNYVSHLNNDKFKFYLLYERGESGLCLNAMQANGIICKKISEKKRKPLRNFLETYKFLRENKIEIIHTHINSMNFVPLFAAYIAHVKVRISHAHNAILENGLNKIFRNFCKDLTKIFSTLCIACGTSAGKYLYQEGILKREFTVLNNAIDINRFKFNEDYKGELVYHYNTHGYFILGNIGRMSKQKNQEFLLEVLSKLKFKIKNIKLVIIGEGELKEHLERKIQDLNLEDDVILVNNTNEIEKYYSYFDIMLLPSLHEGLPLVAIEAQSSNLPILASNTITTEIKLSKNIYFLGLNKISGWVDAVVAEYTKKYNRNDINVAIMNSMYNINNEAIMLEKIYSIQCRK